MWNIRRQQQNQGPKMNSEDSLWNLFVQRATVFGAFIASVAIIPVALRSVGLIDPITYSLGRK
jgi:hypothetical protein